MGRHGHLFSLIKAERSALYLSKEDRFEVSSEDPLDILDSIMGPMGFVIHDIYQINCHTGKNRVANGQGKTTHHLHITGKGSCPSLSAGKDKTSCRLTSQTSVGKSRALFSVPS